MSKDKKLDLYRLHKADYATPKKPTLVRIAKAQYLAGTGTGAPGGEQFQARIGALYGAAFTIKMTCKFEGRGDYVVCKLEGQWWSDEEGRDLADVPPDRWRWRLMIRTPDFIKKKDLAAAVTKLLERGKDQAVKEVELFSLAEGRCVQMLHVGPYDREGETVAEMMEFARAEGLEVCGPHHEIYLSDPRRVAPEKLRTILRLPVRKARR